MALELKQMLQLVEPANALADGLRQVRDAADALLAVLEPRPPERPAPLSDEEHARRVLAIIDAVLLPRCGGNLRAPGAWRRTLRRLRLGVGHMAAGRWFDPKDWPLDRPATWDMQRFRNVGEVTQVLWEKAVALQEGARAEEQGTIAEV